MAFLITIFAPAKINLFLHVTGRRDDGYHLLDSLVSFADIGDRLVLEQALDFELEINGPYAAAFNAKELDASPSSSNLLVRAAWDMARLFKKNLAVKVTLTKNLPLGAGIGGGSSDAAAMIWGLLEYWKITERPDELMSLALKLGADVPACLSCITSRLEGTGEILSPLETFPEIPVVLVYPARASSTALAFSRYHGNFKEPADMPQGFENLDLLMRFLKTTNNDLHKAACESVPEIDNAINALRLQRGCALARMSGSGSSCFGLYEDGENAERAAAEILKSNPDWWVKAGWLGRIERY
jgi:4-diphosphocytidyl-2-C-methyl-D-erythritol kinase